MSENKKMTLIVIILVLFGMMFFAQCYQSSISKNYADGVGRSDVLKYREQKIKAVVSEKLKNLEEMPEEKINVSSIDLLNYIHSEIMPMALVISGIVLVLLVFKRLIELLAGF